MFNDKENMQLVLAEFANNMRAMFLEKKNVMVEVNLYDLFKDNLWGIKVTFSDLYHYITRKYSVESTAGSKILYAAEFLTDEELNNIVKSIKQERDE